MKCIRSILRVSKLNRIRNIEIRRTTGTEKTIVDVLQEKRLKRFSHMCRKPINSFMGILSIKITVSSSNI